MKTRHSSNQASTRITRTTRHSDQTLREEIVDWLRDAYAMERGLVTALEKQAGNEELRPPMRSRAAKHLEETRRHAEDVKAALQSLDADTSALKTGIGVMAQFTKGMGTVFARDERIKELLDAYSMEHFEIACYAALAAGAERAGLPHVVQMCRRILADEERMAQMLKESLPGEVSAYLLQTEAAAT